MNCTIDASVFVTVAKPDDVPREESRRFLQEASNRSEESGSGLDIGHCRHFAYLAHPVHPARLRHGGRGRAGVGKMGVHLSARMPGDSLLARRVHRYQRAAEAMSNVKT